MLKLSSFYRVNFLSSSLLILFLNFWCCFSDSPFDSREEEQEIEWANNETYDRPYIQKPAGKNKVLLINTLTSNIVTHYILCIIYFIVLFQSFSVFLELLYFKFVWCVVLIHGSLPNLYNISLLSKLATSKSLPCSIKSLYASPKL